MTSMGTVGGRDLHERPNISPERARDMHCGPTAKKSRVESSNALGQSTCNAPGFATASGQNVVVRKESMLRAERKMSEVAATNSDGEFEYEFDEFDGISWSQLDNDGNAIEGSN